MPASTLAVAARRNGFTLIEVLAALGLLAAGVLGMSALQQEVLQRNFAALDTSRARFLLQDISERMRAGGGGDAYLLAYEAPPPILAADCAQQACAGDALARWDLAQWRARVAASLPAGEGQVSDEGGGLYAAAIRYGTPRREQVLRFAP